MAGIQRGTMSVRMEYDQNGRITSQMFADGKYWSYTYLEKVRTFGAPEFNNRREIYETP